MTEFVKFDYETYYKNFKPTGKKCSISYGFNEKYPIEYLVDFLKDIFKMEEKTIEEKQQEYKRTQEWKASGIKWRELFVLD